MIFALRPDFKTISIPEYNYQNFDFQNAKPGERPPVKRVRHVRQFAPDMILLADMGENAPAAAKLIQHLIAKDVEKDGAQRSHQTICGAECDIVTPKSVDQDKAPADDEEWKKQLHFAAGSTVYGFRGRTLIISENVQFMEDVLARMTSDDMDSLADNGSHKKTMRILKGPGDFSLFVDVRALVISESGSDAHAPQNGKTPERPGHHQPGRHRLRD